MMIRCKDVNRIRRTTTQLARSRYIYIYKDFPRYRERELASIFTKIFFKNWCKNHLLMLCAPEVPTLMGGGTPLLYRKFSQ